MLSDRISVGISSNSSYSLSPSLKEKSILNHRKNIMDSHYFDAKVLNRLLGIYPEDRPDPFLRAEESKIQKKASHEVHKNGD